MADQRNIKYGNQTMPMPDGMTLDQAKAIMARHFPELAENPKIETKKDGDKTTYVFSKQAGRKGKDLDTNDIRPLIHLTPKQGQQLRNIATRMKAAKDCSEEEAIWEDFVKLNKGIRHQGVYIVDDVAIWWSPKEGVQISNFAIVSGIPKPNAKQ